MARFDVYAFLGRAKFVVDVQADLFVNLDTRLVIPLQSLLKNHSRRMTRLNPVFNIDGADYYLSPAEMAAVPSSLLKSKKINLESRRQDIIDAVDFLMQGF